MYNILKNMIIAIASALIILMTYPAFASDYPNLIIMGWDGAGSRNVQLLMEQERLPNLNRLIK